MPNIEHAPYENPTRKVDVLKDLLELFTPTQLEGFLIWCKAMAASSQDEGYQSEVVVIFKAGKPRFIARRESKELKR